MRLAIVSPTKYLSEFTQFENNKYFMVLAHRYYKDPVYMNFYNKILEDRNNIVILDNGACELKSSIDGSLLFNIALQLRPNILILPDILLDSEKTVSATMKFLSIYYNQLNDIGIELMAVAQGKTYEEWFECFRIFNSDIRIKYLGISNTKGVFPNSQYPRVEVVKEIELKGLLRNNKKIHILGLGDSGHIELEKLLKFASIEGCDSGAPVTHGAMGIVFEEGKTYKKVNKYLEDDTELSDIQVSDINKNLKLLYSIVNNNE